jgi:hypothetical protein
MSLRIAYRKVSGFITLQEYLAHEKTPPPLGLYSRPIPRTLWWS